MQNTDPQVPVNPVTPVTTETVLPQSVPQQPEGPHPIPPLPPPPAPPPHEGNNKVPVIAAIFSFLAVVSLSSIFFVAKNLDSRAKTQKASASEVTPSPLPQTLIVGTDATFPPMEYLDEENNLIGFDIELSQRLGERMNKQIEIKNIPWDDLFKALENGEIDMIVSSVTITPEREVIYSFSDSYLNAGQVIITRRDEINIKSVTDLSDKVIAVQKGTTNEQTALEYTKKENVLVFDDFLKASNALIENQADAIFADLTVAKGIITSNPTLKIASDPFTSDYYGVVMKKDSPLVPSVNVALTVLRQQGVLQFLKQKWLE